jgi:uncharacterized integral membrane protein
MATSGAGPRAPRTFTGRQIIVAVVAVVVLVFALVNLESATIDLIVGQVTMPVFFVIAVPAALGFGMGVLVQRRHRA